MKMAVLTSLLVSIGSGMLLGCESHFVAPHLDVDAQYVVDAAPLIEAAHAEKLRGLEDPSAKERYFSLLRDACERGHSAAACLEANAFDPLRSRALLAHACTIGCDDACDSIFIDEVIREKKTEPQAREDVMRLFQLGCVQGLSPACVKSATNQDFATLKAKFSVDFDRDVDQDAVLVECVGICRERRVACTGSCDFTTWDHCPVVERCASEEMTCAALCKVDPVAMCVGPLGGDCRMPEAYDE